MPGAISHGCGCAWRLEEAETSTRREGRAAAFLLSDTDNFRGLNDTYGHRFGDELLRAVGARLRGCIRAEDTVSRWGVTRRPRARGSGDPSRNAGLALYRVKAEGKGAYRVFSGELYERRAGRSRQEAAVRRAVENRELTPPSMSPASTSARAW